MENTQYIMVGAPLITKELFRNVLRPLDNYNFIPNGGFWASKYINETKISDWYNYLKYAQELQSKKDITKATIFTLKEDAKILTIKNANDILTLAQKFPSYHHILDYVSELDIRKTTFDFEMLSKYYDGIYVNYKNIYIENQNITFDSWQVNTLLLFNLNCIKEYQTAIITNLYGYTKIKDENISIPNQIEKESHEHKILSNLSLTLYKEAMYKYNNYYFEDYKEYFKKVIEESRKVIEIIYHNEYRKIKSIQEYLQHKNMPITDTRIITNIVQNNVTNYLIEDHKRIKTFPKTKIRSLTWY